MDYMRKLEEDKYIEEHHADGWIITHPDHLAPESRYMSLGQAVRIVRDLMDAEQPA